MAAPAASAVPAVVALHAAVALFGLAGLFGKWLALPPYAIVLGRTAIAAAALGLLVALRRSRTSASAPLAANGVILAAHWVTFFEAIRVSSVAIGLLGYASYPLFVLALEGRRPQRIELLTALLVVGGLIVLVPAFDLSDRTVQGLAWGIASALLFAVLTVRSRSLAATHVPTGIALWQNLFAALVLVPFAWLGRSAFELGPREIALLLVLGVVCTALAHTLFIASLPRAGVHAASVVAALEPVYGIALATLLLDEQPTARTLAGGALIVGAALVATRRIR